MLRLLVVVAEAALIVTMSCFALASIPILTGFEPELKAWEQDVLGAAIAVVPAGLAAYWIFRKLRSAHTRREALAVAVTFGVFTPISLGIGLLLSQITGGYLEGVVGRPFFGLIGAILGTAIMTGLMSSIVCALVLRMTRLTMSIERYDQSEGKS